MFDLWVTWPGGEVLCRGGAECRTEKSQRPTRLHWSEDLCVTGRRPGERQVDDVRAVLDAVPQPGQDAGAVAPVDPLQPRAGAGGSSDQPAGADSTGICKWDRTVCIRYSAKCHATLALLGGYQGNRENHKSSTHMSIICNGLTNTNLLLIVT